MDAEKRQVLHLILSQPRRIGLQIEGDGWKKYTFLEVYFGGEHMTPTGKKYFGGEHATPTGKKVGSLLLPRKHGDVESWKEHYKFQVDSGWQHLCLRLEAVREDCDVDEDTGSVKVLRTGTGEPHTSSYTAAIGAAQVRLLDALVLGDDSDDEAVVEKSCLARANLKDTYKDLAIIPAKGTLVFYERVGLQGWRPPGPGRKPTNVVCGTVDVGLYLTEYGHGSGRRSAHC